MKHADVLPGPGLYAITPDGISTDPQGAMRVREVIRGGAVLLQYRDELAEYKQRHRFAEILSGISAATGCPLIINDDVVLARQCGAAGVHLGAADMDIGEARSMLGPQAVIGASCYNRLELGDAALAAGADYLAFGSVAASRTKPGAVCCTPEVLRAARLRFRVPLVAIGGITVENGAALLATGVDYLAVISAVFSGSQPFEQARRFRELFQRVA